MLAIKNDDLFRIDLAVALHLLLVHRLFSNAADLIKLTTLHFSTHLCGGGKPREIKPPVKLRNNILICYPEMYSILCTSIENIE